jgi:hypothetical protein
VVAAVVDEHCPAIIVRGKKYSTPKMGDPKPPEEVRREWDEANDNLVRRAIFSRYLKAVIIRKTERRGPGALDYSAIEPVWREDGEYSPRALGATRKGPFPPWPARQSLIYVP